MDTDPLSMDKLIFKVKWLKFYEEREMFLPKKADFRRGIFVFVLLSESLADFCELI